MQGDDHSADETAPLTIELCRQDGRIVVRRDTALGTFSRTIER
ncbi:hypothetical protein C499_17549 [Halogeometricum borinquense DSM 11551]|uniref:Uncharacterized protein n=1 Tax=Halogeometricum borinquense (strain ATCC 700274 / DSM 11551 / JCM 10706 / KCTC 4070 / PR3) TaxID=469382 RepID=E4NPZ4_HALBP|nr:hypothetical protein [Halogeometricum borinquense]ADQ67739.1 hypothetical protein Hbor_21760 [Halogeometricum borinquense DSM 11551]ELY23579.1 hypothetical protein C499_17549 [Halogeometricum borinquense DSM 11551]